MDTRNLAIVFAPTVLRPLVAETTDAMKVFAEVRMCQVILENLLGQPPADRVLGFTTLTEGYENGAAEIIPEHRPPRRPNHSTAAVNSAAVDAGDIQLDEKMLNRMSHLSVSSGSRVNSHSSIGRPAMVSIEEDEDLDAVRRVRIDSKESDKEKEKIKERTVSNESSDVMDEIGAKFDEEMEAANREHEQMIADRELKAKSKRKSKRRISTVQRKTVNISTI
jgi:hypothetical protein